MSNYKAVSRSPCPVRILSNLKLAVEVNRSKIMATATTKKEVKRVEVSEVNKTLIFKGRGQNLIPSGEYEISLAFVTHTIDGVDNNKQVPVVLLKDTEHVVYLSSVFREKYAVSYNQGQIEESIIEERGSFVEWVRKEADGKTYEELQTLFENLGKKLKVRIASYRGYDYFGQIKMLQYNIFDLV